MKQLSHTANQATRLTERERERERDTHRQREREREREREIERGEREGDGGREGERDTQREREREREKERERELMLHNAHILYSLVPRRFHRVISFHGTRFECSLVSVSSRCTRMQYIIIPIWSNNGLTCDNNGLTM